MEKMIIRIKPEDIKVRNLMHFEVQLNNRMQIRNSKKLYNRSTMKRETRKAIFDC